MDELIVSARRSYPLKSQHVTASRGSGSSRWMKSKLWVFRDIDPLPSRAALAQALSISSATASLLLARGVTTPDEATTWMSHQVPHDPF